jgi:hypothetical protein
VYALPAGFVFLALIVRTTRRLLPRTGSAPVAKPDFIFYGLASAAGIAQAMVLFAGMFFDNLGYLAIPVILAFILMGMSIYRWSENSLSWGPDAVKGPAKSSGQNLRRPVTQMRWAEIASVRITWDSYYLEAADGRKIYWSDYYEGADAFVRALRVHRPTLQLPPGLAA